MVKPPEVTMMKMAVMGKNGLSQITFELRKLAK